MLGLPDAFALFKNKRMAIFFYLLHDAGQPQITNMFGNTFRIAFDKDPLFASSFTAQQRPVMMSISRIGNVIHPGPFRSS